MFVLALDEMLRAATGDTAGRTTQGQGARRAACGVGGAVGPPTLGRVAAEHPEARARPPSPCPDAAHGMRGLCTNPQAAHLFHVTLPGVHASHGQPQSSEEVEPCRD
jgi:hypothetical protein